MTSRTTITIALLAACQAPTEGLGDNAGQTGETTVSIDPSATSTSAPDQSAAVTSGTSSASSTSTSAGTSSEAASSGTASTTEGEASSTGSAETSTSSETSSGSSSGGTTWGDGAYYGECSELLLCDAPEACMAAGSFHACAAPCVTADECPPPPRGQQVACADLDEALLGAECFVPCVHMQVGEQSNCEDGQTCVLWQGVGVCAYP